MLKKILIGVAALLVVVLGLGGYEVWRLYNDAGALTTSPPKVSVCSNHMIAGYTSLPQMLPWTTVSAVVGKKSKHGHAATGGTNQKVCGIADSGSEPTLSSKQRINILVLGTDNDCKGLSLLSQTVFVVTIDPVHHKVGMLSIPRDSWLPIPGSIPGDPYTYHKMDEAMSYGAMASGSTNHSTEFLSGVKYAEETVEANFGIKINYYAWVGLKGFEKVINTLGGVDVNAMHPIVDDWYPGDVLHAGGVGCVGFSRVLVPSGPQYLNGSNALQYVRSRHADLNGDYGRGARQLQTMVALRPKVDSLGLTDFLTVQNILEDLKGSVKTDLSLDTVAAMANFAKTLNLSQIHKVVLTPPYFSEPGMSPDGTQSVVNLNFNRVLPVVNRMFAPISTAPKRPHKPKPVYVSATEAVAFLARVSGAMPQPPKVTTQAYSGPLKGSLYYVDNGNVWKFTKSGTKQVTYTTAIDSADITPNGHKLVFYRRWQQSFADVWEKNMLTGKTKQLTQSRDGDGNLTNAYGCSSYPQCGYVWNYDPTISPNGKTIVYSSDAFKDIPTATLTENADCGYGGVAPATAGAIDPALYAYAPSTGLSAQATASCDGAGGDTDARFNPRNPNQVVYTEFYYLPNSDVASRLVVVNLNANPLDETFHRLTPFHGANMQAAWAPNGKHMAWLGSTAQSTTLYEAGYWNGRLHMNTRRKIDSGLVAEPSFSPDGKHMVYFKLVGSNFQVWIVNLKNGWPMGQPMLLFKQANLTTTSPLVWIKK